MWTCDNPECEYRMFVRLLDRIPTPRPTSQGLLQSAKERQARARRAIMKARAITDRSKRRIAQTDGRVHAKKR
jgi:hypothetical protein